MNATLTAISVFAEQLRNRPTNIQVTESFFLLLINLVSFFGNLLLGIVVIKNPTLRRTVPNMYIITLALSDFLNSCLGIPFSIASLIVGRWPFNDFVCQLQGFWILLLSAVSLQTLAVTAVNRCFRVVRSRTLHQKLFNKKTTKLTIAVLWILALFAPLPYVAAGHKFFFHTGKVFCAHDFESLHRGYGAYLVVFYVAIPLIIIVVCYTKVFITVRKHNLNFRSRLRSVRHEAANLSQNSRLSVDEVNVTYILLAVVVGFLTCWIPVLVIDLIDFVNAEWKLKRQVYVSYTCFGWASTALNPIIYGIMNRSFRAEYLRIFTPLKMWTLKRNIVGEHDNGKDGVKTNMPSRTCTKRKFSQEFEMDERKPE